MTQHRRLVATLLAPLLLFVGCATPFGRDDQRAVSEEPRPELSEPAARLAVEAQPPPSIPTDAGAQDQGRSSPTTTFPPSTTGEVRAPVDTASPTGTHLLTLEDRAGDAGLQAPAYADLLTVTFEERAGRLRVAIDMAGDVPRTLGEGEVQGVGIDVYARGDPERDYQVFLDGGVDGWRAYLQTPAGFVEYPGDFAMGGRRLHVELPWDELGERGTATVSVFCDWSARALPLNQIGNDRVPDSGTARLVVPR